MVAFLHTRAGEELHCCLILFLIKAQYQKYKTTCILKKVFFQLLNSMCYIFILCNVFLCCAEALAVKGLTVEAENRTPNDTVHCLQKSQNALSENSLVPHHDVPSLEEKLARVQAWNDKLQSNGSNTTLQVREVDALKTLFNELKDFGWDKSTWRQITGALNIHIWSSQGHGPDVATGSSFFPVAGHFFFCAALSAPHQKLIFNGVRPLKDWVETGAQEEGFTAAFQAASQHVEKIVATHPYVRRRYALYALVYAATSYHPVAAMVLYHGMKFLAHECGFKEKSLKAIDLILQKNLCLAFNRKSLQNLCDWEEVSAYRDLENPSKEDLQDPEKLMPLHRLGLVHYTFLMGERLKPNHPTLGNDEDLTQEWAFYLQAAEGGDAQACHSLSVLLNYILDKKRTHAYNKFTPQEIRNQAWI